MRHQTETVLQTGGRIAGIARSAEAATLGLLAAIDGTVDAMHGIAQVTRGFVKIIAAVCEQTAAARRTEGDYIDPDDVAIDMLAKTVATLKDILPVMIKKRASIDCDDRLKDHHCEALHAAYEDAMSATVELIDIVEATRTAIIRHDLAAEPRSSEVFATVDALITNLRSQ